MSSDSHHVALGEMGLMIYISDALSTTITISKKESFISDPEMSSASIHDIAAS